MKRVALTMVLACASMACSSTTTTTPMTAYTLTKAQDKATTPTIAAEPIAATVPSNQWLGAAGGSEYVLTGGQDQFVGVWVDVPRSQRRAHVPMSITLTIDTSGSMTGQKILQARQAASSLVSNMKDGDLISIQAFSNSARTLVQPTVLDEKSREHVLGTIAELQAGGATNMFDGLDTAISKARHTPDTHPVRRVVMISDGKATAGQTSEHALGQLAENGTQFGVQVTALGVGLDYNEKALNTLAVRSSGRLYHLADSKEMKSVIVSELKLLQSTTATNAFVETVPAPGVELIGATHGVRASWAANKALRLPLGTMHEGQRRELLVRYRLTTAKVEGNQAIVSARLHFNDPADNGIARVHEVVVHGKLTSDASLVAEYENDEVQAIIAVQDAANLTLAASAQVNQGNWNDADAQLAKAEKNLRDKAKKAKTKKDRQRMTTAAEGIARNRRSIQKAAKAPKPSPSARRKEALKMNDEAMGAMGY